MGAEALITDSLTGETIIQHIAQCVVCDGVVKSLSPMSRRQFEIDIVTTGWRHAAGAWRCPDHNFVLFEVPHPKRGRVSKKLSDSDIENIMKELDNGISGARLSEKYGVTPSWISQLRQRRRG